ncbi:YczE/YyaS/YitT family protein [Parabacteroides sp.]
MKIKDVIKKYSVFILGLYFLAVGIVLIVRSTLGTTPISSVNYVLSLNTPLSLGTWTFIVNVFLILGQFWLIRKDRRRQDIIEILLQIPFSFIFSAFIDFNMVVTSNLHPSSYGLAMALLLVGCLVQSIGVVLEIKPKVAMMSAEAFVKYASRCCNKEFGKFKVYFDVTLVTMAVILSLMFTQNIEGIREGSLIAACITGYIVSFLNQKIMTRKTLHKLLPIKNKGE